MNWCSIEKRGLKCAEKIEKEIGAEIRGTLTNSKEKASGKCVVCRKDADKIVYIGKSY